LAIRKDPLTFLYEFESRIGIKKFGENVRKNWTPPFAQVCGNMYNYVLKNSSHHPKKWIIRFDPYGIVPLTKETLACSSLDLRGNSIGTDDDDDDTHFNLSRIPMQATRSY
jgi:hypothetical protein